MSRKLPTIIRSLLIVATLHLSALSAFGNENVYDSVIASTTMIMADGKSGSGVLVDEEKGYVVTNHHVIDGDDEVLVFFPAIVQGRIECDVEYYLQHSDEFGIPAKVVGYDVQRDLAVLKLASVPKSAKAVAMGASARPGQLVHSIGNPDASDAMWVYTAGYVRANYYKRMMDNRMQVVETSSPTNPGDSGGPILNDKAELVGITQSFMIEGRLVSNGVDITEVRWFVEKVRREEAKVASPEKAPGNESSEDSPSNKKPAEPGKGGLKSIFAAAEAKAASYQKR